MPEKPVKVRGNTLGAGKPQKTSIRRITDYLIGRITEMGLDVIVSFSRYSKSRYLEVNMGRHGYVIRISDHPLRSGRFDFDVFTDRPRRGADHYLTFMDRFKKAVKKDRKDGQG